MDQSQRAELRGTYEKLTDIPMIALALAMVPLSLLPYIADLSTSVESAVDAAFWVVWAAFAVDLAIATYLSERRLQYLVSHWYDVLIVALIAAVPYFGPTRVLRSARGLRLLRLGRILPVIARITADARNLSKTRGLQWVLLLGAIAVLACALLVWDFERTGDGSIGDFGTALWWAMSTVTTVGYGDATPVTTEGRLVAVFLMVIGIGFFSWVTANIAAFLVESPSDGEAVTTADLMRKLDALEDEIKALRGRLPG